MQKSKWTLERIRSGIRWRYRKMRRITWHRLGSVLYRNKFEDYEQLYRLAEGWFDFGVAAESERLGNNFLAEIGNPKKEFLISRCFNSVSCENSFKPVFSFNPKSPSLFSINPAAVDVLSFAKKNNLKIRIHVLVWHKNIDHRIFCRDYQCIYEDEAGISARHILAADCLVSRDELLSRLERYIHGAVEYVYANGYAANVSGWDVVNEAASNHSGEYMRNSYWMQLIGPEYVYYSFQYARDAVTRCAAAYADLYPAEQRPMLAAKLFYNDNREWLPEKREKIIRLLTEERFCTDEGTGTLLGDGLVDGIGMQCHISTALDPEVYMDALREYKQIFGLVHITELDVVPADSGICTPAELYEAMFLHFREASEQGIGPASVTIWGLSDDRSWLTNRRCSLLFDAACRRKEEFAAVVRALTKR